MFIQGSITKLAGRRHLCGWLGMVTGFEGTIKILFISSCGYRCQRNKRKSCKTISCIIWGLRDCHQEDTDALSNPYCAPNC